MQVSTFGNENNPVIVMLSGSFCPARSMEYIYNELRDDYYIIAPDYNGHYEGSIFTTRQNEAKQIADYIADSGLTEIKMIYGQSMGAEIGIEMLRQLIDRDIRVDKSFFDGAPCIKLSKAYKQFMYLKFRTLMSTAKGKSAEDVLKMKMLNVFTNGDNESLRPMIESMIEMSRFVNDDTVRNETECCYTFDYPPFAEDTQKRMYFFYAKDEKAFKTCFKFVKEAYPYARYQTVRGYGHLTYSVRQKDEYIKLLRKICER